MGSRNISVFSRRLRCAIMGADHFGEEGARMEGAPSRGLTAGWRAVAWASLALAAIVAKA